MDASNLIHYGRESDDITMISIYIDDFILEARYYKSID